MSATQEDPVRRGRETLAERVVHPETFATLFLCQGVPLEP
jgi:hypothetical protein